MTIHPVKGHRLPLAIIFDLDGTLIDSAPDIHAAVNRLMTTRGLPEFDLPQIISFIGHGLPNLARCVMAARRISPTEETTFTDELLRSYSAASATLTRPYSGVVASLQALAEAGHPMGICTNKPEAPARHILAALGLESYFDAVVGGDTLARRKPEAQPLLHTMALLGTDECLYVGDSEVDAETALAARVPFLLFSEGYRKTPVQEIPHQRAFSEFSVLPGLIAKIAGQPA